MRLREWEKHFSETYGIRNALFTGGLSARVDLFNISISDLQDAVRRGRQDGGVHQIALTLCIAQVFCVADYFRGSLPLIRSMVEKYPAAGCSYCHTKPCTCEPGSRPEHTPFLSSAEQYSWTLQEWQQHVDEVYGADLRQRGIGEAFNRLTREVTEFRSATLLIPEAKSSSEDILRELAMELADVLTWIISVAIILETDLDAAVAARYGQGCTSCHAKPCICTHFPKGQIDWEALLDNGQFAVNIPSELLPR